MPALKSKEHYEIMDQFERLFKGHRMDREDKSLWPRGHIYQNGETNNLFIAFRHGFEFGRAIYAP